jgi:ABC-type Co2+ transport system permease subunit
MGYLGLIVIIVAWLVQIYAVWKGAKEIQAGFLIIYAIGTLLLVINSLMTGSGMTAFLNFLDSVAAVLVVWMLKRTSPSS